MGLFSKKNEDLQEKNAEYLKLKQLLCDVKDNANRLADSINLVNKQVDSMVDKTSDVSFEEFKEDFVNRSLYRSDGDKNEE